MELIDEEHDNDYLTPAQDTEEKLNSIDYDVWHCPHCHETEVLPYVRDKLHLLSAVWRKGNEHSRAQDFASAHCKD